MHCPCKVAARQQPGRAALEGMLTVKDAPILWDLHLYFLVSMVVDNPDAVAGCSTCRLALSAAEARNAALVHIPPALDGARGLNAWHIQAASSMHASVTARCDYVSGKESQKTHHKAHTSQQQHACQCQGER